ncbi:MAG: hypothetical protein ACRCS8_06300 [Brevinema sp.]
MMFRLLAILVLATSVSYSKIHKDIELMLPMERSVLAQSMEEVAKVYEELGNKRKADQFYKVALEVFPVGDRAHLLAEKLNADLNDEDTFARYEDEGIMFFENGDNRAALQSFMMALQIKATLPLYEHLAKVHRALGNEQSATTFEQLAAEGIANAAN